MCSRHGMSARYNHLQAIGQDGVVRWRSRWCDGPCPRDCLLEQWRAVSRLCILGFSLNFATGSSCAVGDEQMRVAGLAM